MSPEKPYSARAKKIRGVFVKRNAMKDQSDFWKKADWFVLKYADTMFFIFIVGLTVGLVLYLWILFF